MSKIEELTQEQQNRLIEFRDKWLAIGTCTDPANRTEAERGIRLTYEIGGLKSPRVIWCGSPLSSGLTKAIVLNFKDIFSVGVSVGDSVGDSVRASVRASVWASGYGQHDASWLGFYDYFSNVLRLEKQTEKLKGLWIIAQSANWFIPHQNICWISERHNICRLKDGRIHCDGGPAIVYPDGFSVWALNGVRVSKEIAEVPRETLDPKLILTEKNSEVRREIVRKIGIEKIMEALDAKSVDRQEEYELILLDLQDGRHRPYLRMRSPSTGLWHLEGVHPDCKNVEQALNWRNQSDEKPEILT